MSLGVSSQLAPRTVSRSFTHALHTTAFTTLAAAFLIVLTLQADQPEAILWPAMVVLIPQVAVLALVGRFPTWFFASAYLVVGGVSVYSFSLTIWAQLSAGAPLIGALELMPSVALLLVGGSGVGVLAGFGWSTAGYLVGLIAASIARWQLGLPIQLEIVTTSLYLFTILMLVLVWFTSTTERRATPGLTRATENELVAQMRWRVESRSAALLHDTILSHLAAVTNAPDRIPEGAREQMRRDLDQILDEAWLDAALTPATDRSSHEHSPVFAAIRDVEALGLQIDLTGELGALDSLDDDEHEELALAVHQCLVNVLKHSGVLDAEVSISGTEHEVLVMVIDAGAGFVENEVPSDRLGLRGSIRGRIADAGGTVQVWSTIGLGTSVIIRFPSIASARDSSSLPSASSLPSTGATS